MDECLPLDECLIEDDFVCVELGTVVWCAHDDAVTVTVTVDCGQLLQSEAPAAAANPIREATKILGYIP